MLKKALKISDGSAAFNGRSFFMALRRTDEKRETINDYSYMICKFKEFIFGSRANYFQEYTN